MLVDELGERLTAELKEQLLDDDNDSTVVCLALNNLTLKQLVFSIDFLKAVGPGGVDENALISAIGMGSQ
eukprot:gnl/Chilomastix_caulleri/2426.p3 GENE.gnl/Chilomastix_caulleri/2426~~gnl/Chilomastix_caulleri/2426.p3  ORF type:complete len:70 (+),score=34.44 gnl/Chilomastix_caulleri/2426:183-392(+)